MRRLTDEDRIIGYFMERSVSDIEAMLPIIQSIVRRRIATEAKAPARGRPPGTRNKSKAEVAEMQVAG